MKRRVLLVGLVQQFLVFGHEWPVGEVGQGGDESAVTLALGDVGNHTPDLGGTANTEDLGRAIVDTL